MRVVQPTPEGYREAVDALRKAMVVAYPTETVYGLGVDPFSDEALDRVYTVKRRQTSAPLLLVIGDRAQLDTLVASVSDRARRLIDAFWPGPLSLLFPGSDRLPRRLCNAQGFVCVRWTSCRIAQEICCAFGGAITSTSANRSGEPPAVRISDVEGEGIEVAVDGGPLESAMPSTVFNPETGELLREGAIPRDRLAATID